MGGYNIRFVYVRELVRTFLVCPSFCRCQENSTTAANKRTKKKREKKGKKEAQKVCYKKLITDQKRERFFSG